MSGEYTDKNVGDLVGKTVLITQGRYKGEIGKIKYIETEEGHTFFVVALESGEETYLIEDFFEVVKEKETGESEMKVKKIEFTWNENVVNPCDVVNILIEENGNHRDITIMGAEAEEILLEIEEVVKKWIKKIRRGYR